ncbi:substrate-binding domain-containing protein [Halorientalis brevis]|uniref:Substrate-binding domain-containing protein n=1 Tax=Halorientalis brevis TaxID=1126241 RepID=A0ABD6C9R6_9EURY|nr:substrate-binding domain-containing protein [Halorientalis brevis]
MSDSPPNRREFLRATGLAAALTGIAGCVQDRAPGTAEPNSTTATDEPTATATAPESTDAPTATETEVEETTEAETTEEEPTESIPPLTADGSSTIYPIANKAASYWNSNVPADDREYWPHAEYGIETDENLADYWAGKNGFEPTGERSTPPYVVNVGLSHSERGVKSVQKGRVDIGNSSAPVAAELPDADQSTLDSFVDHVVAVDGQPIVVSREIYDAGVTKLTGDELKKIYTKEITNWSELGGPDREIQAIARAEGSGTDTAFRANLYGDPEAPIEPDVRKEMNQQVKQLVEQSDNAIAYLALAFVEPDGPVPPVALELDGTTYEYGENLGAKEYPLSRDLHCYTWKDTSKKEAAFLDMVLSEFGQDTFVADNHYLTLPENRRATQRRRLPSRN